MSSLAAQPKTFLLFRIPQKVKLYLKTVSSVMVVIGVRARSDLEGGGGGGRGGVLFARKKLHSARMLDC